MTVEEIARRYPNQWLAMLPGDNSVRELHPDHRGLRVVLHESDVHLFDRELLKLHEHGHAFRVYVTFTGSEPPPGSDLTPDIAAGAMVAIELRLLQEDAMRCRRCRTVVYPVVTRASQRGEWARYRLYWDCRCGISGWRETALDWTWAESEAEAANTGGFERLTGGHAAPAAH